MILAIVAVIVVVLIGSGLYASGVFNGGSPSPSPSGNPTTSVSPSGNPTTSVGGTITYQNSTVGVKFSYPQTWIVSNNPTSGGKYPTRYFSVWPPLPSGVNSTVDTRYVGFYNESKTNYTENNDTAIILDKISSNFNFTIEGNNATNVTLVENFTPTTFGGMPAYEAVWSFNLKSPGTLTYNKQIWTVKGDRLYGIIYGSGQNYYSTSLPQVDQIINSFEFI